MTTLKIDIEIPDLEKLLASGQVVPLAPAGIKWSASILGTYSRSRGVYVLHSAGEVQYVGKTEGRTMSFGMRLRREFQETASQNKHIYPKLIKLPSPIKAVLLSEEDVDRIVTTDALLTPLQKVALLEIVLIQAYKPRLQDTMPTLAQVQGIQP